LDLHRRPGDPRMTGPGLQSERTDLAWRRTALAAAGCALVLLDVAIRGNLTLLTLLPAILTATAAVTLALLGRRPDDTPVTARPRVLAMISMLLAAAALAALELAI